MKHVIAVATEGKTTLFKASELLEFTMEPFQYARRAAQDNFDLSRHSADSLRSYDSSFTKMMSARLESDMALASSCEEDCFRHLGKCGVFSQSDSCLVKGLTCDLPDSFGPFRVGLGFCVDINFLLRCSESALKEAESDCHMWAEHLKEEEQQLESLGKLDEVKGEVKESINDEIYELKMIRDQCVKDSRTIGEGCAPS